MRATMLLFLNALLLDKVDKLSKLLQDSTTGTAEGQKLDDEVCW